MARTSLPIGLEFGASQMRMVQLAPAGQGWSVTAASSRPVPTDLPDDWAGRWSELAPVVSEMLASAPFQGRHVITGLPAAALHYKNLRMPPMPPDEIAKAIEFEAADRLGLENTGCQVQYFTAGEVQQGDESRLEIIVMAAPAAMVAEHVQMLLKCGFEPEVIDATPSMMARCLISEGDPDPEAPAQMIVDLGHSATKVLIAQNGRVVFFKVIEVGGRHLDDRLCEKLKLSAKDAADRRRKAGVAPADDADVANTLKDMVTELGREIGLCMRYFNVTFRGNRPDHGWVVGGETADPTLIASLTETVGMELRPFDPLEGIKVEGAEKGLEQGGPPPAWAMAIALAKRGAQQRAKRGAA